MSRVLKNFYLIFFGLNLILATPLLADRGVSFDRYFIHKGVKYHEKVLVYKNLMRVDSKNFSYLFDLEKNSFFYHFKEGSKLKEYTLEDLKKQCSAYASSKSFEPSTFRVKVNKNEQAYKGFETISAKLLKIESFILIRLAHKNEMSKYVSSYLKALYEKIGCNPVLWESEALSLDNPANFIFYILGELLSYKNVKIPHLPIYIFRSSPVFQMDISNLSYITVSKEKLYRDFSVNSDSGWFDKLLSFFDGDKKRENAKDENKPKESNSSWKEVGPSNQKVEVEPSGRKKFKYSIFWTTKKCPFFESSKKLYLKFDTGALVRLPRGNYKAIKKVYKKTLSRLASIRRSGYGNLNKNIDEYLYSSFKRGVKNNQIHQVAEEEIIAC